ncbi:Retrovirus-related Pol polyprotein from transposon RE1 [Vitis vinifera]|uniref:Retrovirus-related Pol polyprotein from transposon RE1 n=1 Tax=Vitis vinifera TaxID=29760 RepID=A0A438HW60_VITVI|nr:Retrovirus-related Pol polyprotein from transposon RE1 [Vitis vinifera]
MSGCQPVNSPIEEGMKLCVELNQVSTNKGRYQRLVGRLMYLAHTRPDLAYALSVNAPGKGILFAENVDHQSIEAYTDVDWAGAVDDRRSTSGYFTFVGGNLVTWKSYLSKQPIRLFCDNKAACDIAHNPVHHDRTKHVEVDRFFIKEKLDDKIVELPKIRSEDQLADILTKAISSQVFSKFLEKLGMCDIHAPT